MTLYVSEHYGVAGLFRGPAITVPGLTYALSSSTAGSPVSLKGPVFPGANVTYIRVCADTAMLLCMSSTGGSPTVTSTNSIRISSGGAPVPIAVSTVAALFAAST